MSRFAAFPLILEYRFKPRRVDPLRLFRLNRGKGVDTMLRSIAFAALGTGFTFLMTTLGAAVVFFFKKALQPKLESIILGFAAGVMTAASIWSLLLPSVERAELSNLHPVWLPAAVGLLLGAVFLVGMDAIVCRMRSFSDEGRRRNFLLSAAIVLHNIPEGMAVGLAFALAVGRDSLAAAAALALGIGIQNFPEGAAISLPLHQAGKSRLKSFVLGMLSGIVEPIFGIFVVLAAAGCSALMPWLLSFAAGAMLYVVVEELVPQANGKVGTAGFLLGFLVMMVLDIALG